MKYLVSTENIWKTYKSGLNLIHALKDVSICISPHSFTVLKGRSGSGKTTLMNMLGALDKPDRGKVLYRGDNICEISENDRNLLRRKKIGFIHQSVALISIMSAYENIEFALRLSGYDKSVRKKRAMECLSIVGLVKRMHHRPNELSGGEQQRVAIARAICHRPEIIFADEPTAELDTHMGLQIVKIFKTLVKDEGLTVVMSSHDPNMIDISDYMFTLEDGEIIGS